MTRETLIIRRTKEGVYLQDNRGGTVGVFVTMMSAEGWCIDHGFDYSIQ